MNKEQQKKLIIDIMNDDAKDGLYKQQTAVEYLEKAIDKYVAYIEGNPDAKIFTSSNLYLTVEQAKEMEKQQIINGRITAPITTGDIELDRQEAEHYYTQEYGGKK